MESFISIPVLMFLPLIVAILINLPMINRNYILIRRFVSGFSVFYTLYSLLLYVFYINDIDALQFNPEYVSSIPFLNNNFLSQLGINVSFGVDSLSILMIILTSTIFMFSILASKLFITKHHRTFYTLILCLESILVGIFSSVDMFVFFVLWELELIPMYLFISLWGDKKSKKAALKFVLYTFGGSLFILLGILLLYYTNFSLTGDLTSDISRIGVNNLPYILQLVMSISFLIGFGVKIPLVPLHRWLADAHTNATTPVSMVLAAILLKLGVYGLIRFNYALLPLGFMTLTPILGGIALINIIYGAALAYYQQDIKKIVAYSSISQMGLVILGLVSMNAVGYKGAVFHMISHALVAAGLFFVVGIIKLKFRTRNIKRLSGIANVCPRLFGFASMIGLAGVGIPFLSGFIGEFLSIYGAVISQIWILKFFAFVAIGIIMLSALYILRLIHEVFYANFPDKYSQVQDIAVHEFVVLGGISFLILLLGVCPYIIINFLNA